LNFETLTNFVMNNDLREIVTICFAKYFAQNIFYRKFCKKYLQIL